MSESVAVYAGFFDPFTLGHLNIVQRSARVFDRLIVAVAGASPKQSLFSNDERFEMISEIVRPEKNVQVDRFEGLLVNYLKQKKMKVVIRGLRTLSDFEYELQMALANKKLAEDVETFFMMTDESFSFLSSTLIKEIARLGGDVSGMVPPIVATQIRKKYEAQPKS